jgi:hypothetical protein
LGILQAWTSESIYHQSAEKVALPKAKGKLMRQGSMAEKAVARKISSIFCGIRQRCLNKNSGAWKWYGGKGVKALLTKQDLMDLWIRDKADTMLRPSIDRIDSNGNYEIGNCRFLELRENAGATTFKNGTKNINAKLTRSKVLKIRRLFKDGFKESVIAKMIPCGRCSVYDVVDNRYWVDVR